MSLRLCCARAADDRARRAASRRSRGTGIARLPDRYWPVSDAGSRARPASGVPSATTWPPCSPAPGPRSTRWSAARIVPSSCSTTITVLPRSRSRSSVVDQLRVVALVQADRGLVEDVEHADQARADLGREPDPLRLAARERRRRALQRQVADADVVEEAQPLVDLAHDQPRDRPLGLGQLERLDPLERRRAPTARVNSWMLSPPTVTARLSGRSRAPSQAGHGCTAMYSSIRSRVLVRVGLLVAALEAVRRSPRSGPCRSAGGRSGCGRRPCGARRRCRRGSSSRSLVGQVLPRRVEVDPVLLGDRLEQPLVVARRRARPRQERALADRERRVGDDQLGVDHPLEAEPVAALAGAVRRVEGEDPRLELGHRGAAVEAGELLAEDEHLAALAGARPRDVSPGDASASVAGVDELDLDQPVGERDAASTESARRLRRSVLHHQAVDDDRDVVLVLLVELDLLVEPAQLAVDHGPRVALGAHLLEQLPVLALAPADDRRQDHEPRALVEGHHAVDDLLDRLARRSARRSCGSAAGRSAPRAGAGSRRSR